MTGREWVVDAYGCRPEDLKSRAQLEKLFTQMIHALELKPVAPPTWHQFADPGGWTGFVILEESHLAVHTFPEHGSLCLSLFCSLPAHPQEGKTSLPALHAKAGVHCYDCHQEEKPSKKAAKR